MLIALHKPFGVLCQFTDSQGRPTLADYLDRPGLYPAGRLDLDSEGLVLLTDDGRLQHAISAPESRVPKVYHAQVDGVPRKAALDRLRRGPVLSDGPCRPVKVELLARKPPYLGPREPPIRQRRRQPTSWLAVTLTEGRNRQVRRMTAAIGLPTLRLVRFSVGSCTLANLAPGAWLLVDPEEVVGG